MRRQVLQETPSEPLADCDSRLGVSVAHLELYGAACGGEVSGDELIVLLILMEKEK